MRTFLGAIVGLLSLASCVVGQTPTKKYALLVGVSKYQHATMNKPAPLQFPEIDAKAVGDLLRDSGYEVDMLLGSQATQPAIRDKLKLFKQRGEDGGVVVIALFGHGVEFEVSKEACFCPYDTTIREVTDKDGKPVLRDGQTLTEPDPESLIKIVELMNALSVCGASNRVLLADCCREQPNRARGRAFGSTLKANQLPENTAALFACSANEQAFEHPDWGHGAFTKCLLDEIAVLQNEGAVTMGSLADRIQPKVLSLVKAKAIFQSQTTRSLVTDRVDLQIQLKTLPKVVTSRVTGAEFVLIPAGKFMMGSPAGEGYDFERPQHEVRITKPFYLGKTEVTQKQWETVMGTTPWAGRNYVKEGPDYPATCVSWDDAVAYCKKLSEKEGRPYRLPTEAEWEYACRAGSTGKYTFGDSESELLDYAWIDKNADEVKEEYAHEVGRKRANRWGLHDIHGNVWEWCSDYFDEKFYGFAQSAADPVGPDNGSYRVRRGGGWNDASARARSAYRGGVVPAFRLDYLGFRVAFQFRHDR